MSASITFTPAPMPLGRVARAYLVEAKYESLRMLRAPAFAVPFLMVPVALYAFFGALAGNGSSSNPNVPTFLYTGFSTFAAMGPAMFGFGLALALEREQGVYKLKRALPMPPPAYLFAKMLMAMFFAALAASGIAVAALALGRAPFAMARMVGILAILIAGTIPFSAIGLFIGARVSGRAAPAVVNVVYLAMVYLSGLFIPLPESIRWIALFSPAFHLNQLCLAMAGAGSILLQSMHIAALIGVSVVFTGLTIRRLTHEG
jgi:ABC-2 type transport system permease protein